MLRFDGRVAVVTGAGAGLGRCYALLLAERGAKVVVNDLGGSRSGDGSNSKAADSVVLEIKKAGGIAVPDYNSVVEGAKIIQTAIDSFGRIDILINNAGILRDKSFQNLPTADWDIIHDVHLKAAFLTTQAAWSHFRSQKYGRIIFTSSNAGLFGNFGQANYSAAKMGLVGLCNTVSIEGKKYNIKSNVIVPTAASRLTEDILPPDLFEQLKPELIAPVVIWLCHEGCEETGSIIESAAGWAGKLSIGRGKGVLLRRSIADLVPPETVQEKWSEITNMEGAENMASIEEVTYALMSCLEKLTDSDESDDDSEGYLEKIEFSEKDFITYSLGIGASVLNAEDLKYLYENHSEFSPFPTHAIIPGQMAIMSWPKIINAIPNTTIDLSEVLHGEQYLEIYKLLPVGTPLHSELQIVDVLDKGKNAVIIIGANTTDTSTNELVSYNEMAIVVRGKGGFGGHSNSTLSVPLGKTFTTAPDVICLETISHSQGALYRLSGDFNPLHIDPDFAQMSGFKKPIIHGLCTLGISARHVLARFGGNNPAYFKAIKARFVKPFYPGETLKTLMWREGNRIYFQSQAMDKTVLISGAYVDLHKVIDVALPYDCPIKVEFDVRANNTMSSINLNSSAKTFNYAHKHELDTSSTEDAYLDNHLYSRGNGNKVEKSLMPFVLEPKL